MSKHSPLPWRRHDDTPYVTVDGNGADVFQNGNIENHIIIRKAVSNHYKLIIALKNVIEAAERALGDHMAPMDCYATGPMTGDIHDLIACPGCIQQNEIEDARKLLKELGETK